MEKKPNYKYWYHHATKAIQQTFDSSLINVIILFRMKKGGETSMLNIVKERLFRTSKLELRERDL